MNCSKCNQPMKEYRGLVETGWDCVNPKCGEQVLNKDVLPGNSPLLVDNDTLPLGWDFGYSSTPVVTDPGPVKTDNSGKIKANYSKATLKIPGAYPSTYPLNSPTDLSDADKELAADIAKALEEAMTKMFAGYSTNTACGQQLDNLAKLCFGIDRYFDETDEDLRFRLKASLDQ